MNKKLKSFLKGFVTYSNSELFVYTLGFFTLGVIILVNTFHPKLSFLFGIFSTSLFLSIRFFSRLRNKQEKTQ